MVSKTCMTDKGIEDKFILRKAAHASQILSNCSCFTSACTGTPSSNDEFHIDASQSSDLFQALYQTDILILIFCLFWKYF